MFGWLQIQVKPCQSYEVSCGILSLRMFAEVSIGLWIVRTRKGIKWTCRHMGYHEKLFTTSLNLSILLRAVLYPLSFNFNFQNNVTIMWWTNFIETKQLGESRSNLVQRHTPSAKITQITNDKTTVFKWLAESPTS